MVNSQLFVCPFQDLIKKLLRRPVARRLGSNEGAKEIMTHAFFKGVNWRDVLCKKIKPPFIPSVSSQEDVSNFDLRFTSKVISRESDEKQTESAATASKENGNHEEGEVLFPDFDYISPEMSGHWDDKIFNIQDLRIRGYGNPWWCCHVNEEKKNCKWCQIS